MDMNTTVSTPAFVMNLPMLFDSIDYNKFEQKIEDAQEARQFADSIREQHGNFVEVEQRIGRVIITIK